MENSVTVTTAAGPEAPAVLWEEFFRTGPVDVLAQTEYDETEGVFICQLFRNRRLVGARRSVPVDPAGSFHDSGGAFHQREVLFLKTLFYLAKRLEKQGTATEETSVGQAFLVLGFFPEAEACFRWALERDPDSSEAHFRLAGVCHRLGKCAEAEALYRKALSLQPYADYANALGLLQLEGGKVKEAEEAFRQALEINPNYAEALLNLGHLYLEQAGSGKGRATDECFAAAEVYLSRAHLIAHAATSGADTKKEHFDRYEALCRIYLKTKNQLVAQHDSSNRRALCEVYLLALKYLAHELSAEQIGQFYFHLLDATNGKPDYPDLKNYAGLIVIFSGLVALEKAALEIVRQEKDERALELVLPIQQVLTATRTLKEKLAT